MVEILTTSTLANLQIAGGALEGDVGRPEKALSQICRIWLIPLKLQNSLETMINRARSLAVFLLIAGLSGKSAAMEFLTHPDAASMPAVTAILASGDVEEGDVKRLSDFLSRTEIHKNVAVYLASHGGSLYEGMRLGLFFKKNRIKTVVEGGQICASACALTFLGGRDNQGKPWRSSSSNSRLGFHAFASPGSSLQDENETQKVVAHVLAYGREVDAPLELLIRNFATPSNTMYWLKQDEICSLGIKLWDVPGNRFVC